jgi:hypothetical protein
MAYDNNEQLDNDGYIAKTNASNISGEAWKILRRICNTFLLVSRSIRKRMTAVRELTLCASNHV